MMTALCTREASLWRYCPQDGRHLDIRTVPQSAQGFCMPMELGRIPHQKPAGISSLNRLLVKSCLDFRLHSRP